MSDSVKMGIKLLLITAVATFALALTQMVTQEPILAQRENSANEARKAVLPEAQEFRSLDFSNDEYPDIIEITEGISGDSTVGYTFRMKSRGYGGDIIIIAGIGTDETVKGIRVVQHSETPGLGARSQEPAFQDQFAGLSAGSEIQSSDIQAITGATITSKAVTKAVNTAIGYYRDEIAGGGNQ